MKKILKFIVACLIAPLLLLIGSYIAYLVVIFIAMLLAG